MPDLFNMLLGTGVEPKDLNSLQVSIRAVVVFFSALLMVRLADRRFLSRKTAFDAVLGFILASTLARSVNGSAPLLPTLVAGVVMVLLHRFLAKLGASYHGVGVFLKGRSDVLIQEGVLLHERARANHLSENDVMEDIRLNGHVARVEDVELGYLERNGDISVVPKKKHRQ